MKKDTERAELLFNAMKITHEKSTYRNARGLQKMGLINPVPVTDMKSKEFMIRAEQVLKRDRNGIPIETVVVMVSREEALMEMDFLPSPAEIEERKRQCKFLYPENHRIRMDQKPDAMTIPFIVQAERSMPNRPGRSEY